MSETLNPTPHPLEVLERIETMHRHPAGRKRRDPITTANDFHDEIDAPTGRALPRHYPARTASCAPAPRPIRDLSPLRAGEAAGILTITLLLMLGVLVPILAVAR